MVDSHLIDYTKLSKYSLIMAKRLARKICNDTPTKNVDIVKEYHYSQESLGKFATLDPDFIKDIGLFRQAIERYSNDRTLTRPLNFLMLADPGTGKSFFVECLSKAMNDFGLIGVDCNLSTFRDIGDMLPAIEMMRNHKVNDKLPILLIDEFDVLDDMASLLPLLWDGTVNIGHSKLRTGKAIIILAGSRPDVGKYVSSWQSMTEKQQQTNEDLLKIKKLNDLLSRINGGYIRLPTLKGVQNKNLEIVCIANKICITIAALQSRFGKHLYEVPWALLRLIASISFKHNIRSLVTFLNFIDNEKDILESGVITVNHLKSLPLNDAGTFRKSCVNQHLRTNRNFTVAKIIKKWNEYCIIDSTVRFQVLPPKP